MEPFKITYLTKMSTRIGSLEDRLILFVCDGYSTRWKESTGYSYTVR